MNIIKKALWGVFVGMVLFSVCGLTNPKEKRVIKIAVIDTGFGFQGQGQKAKLCKYGHKDFSMDQQSSHAYGTKDQVPIDLQGHGTNIVGLIEQYANLTEVDYCIVIIKAFSMKPFFNNNFIATVNAIKYATKIKADIVNYSAGGNTYFTDEIEVVKNFLDKGGIFVAAAGNESKSLDVSGYYPAFDDPRVMIVGNSGANSTNYGFPVDRWENGNNQEAYGLKMTGTSQATAIATGKILSKFKKHDKQD